MEFWILLTLLSALLFAIKDVLTKKFFSNKDISPSQLTFEQYIFAIFISLLVFLPQINFTSFYDYYFLFILKALAIGTSTYLYLEMLKEYEISIVSPLLNLSPLILVIFSTVLLGETITLIQIGGIMLIIVATYFLEVNIRHHDKKNPHKLHLIHLKKTSIRFFGMVFGTLMMMSLAAIMDKSLFNIGVNVMTNMYFTALLISGFIFVYYAKEKRITKSLKSFYKEPETLLIASLAIFSNITILFAIAISSSLISLIVPIRRTSTLMSAILGGILFHEKHLLKKMSCTLIMLVGVLLIVF